MRRRGARRHRQEPAAGRAPRTRPRRRACACCAARGSELEREFGFGVVRQLFEADRRRPGAAATLLSGRRGAGRARCSARPQRGRRGGASFAALHGLYWLVVNLAARRPLLLSVDDLHWADRAVAALPGLPRAPARRPAVLVACGAAQRRAPASTRRCSASSRDQPTGSRSRPAPLSQAAVAALLRDASAASPRGLRRRRATGAPAATRCCCASSCARSADDGVPPDAAHAGPCAQIGPRAVSRTVLLRLARLDAAASRWRARSRSSARAPSCAPSRRSRGWTSSEVAEALAALASRRDPAARRGRGFVHPLVRDAVYDELRPASVSSPTRGAATCWATPARRPSRGRAALARTAPRRRRGRRAPAPGGAGGRAAAGRPRARWRTGCARSRSRPMPARRRGPARARPRRGADLRAVGRREHLAEAIEGLDDPDERALRSRVLTRAVLFTRAPSEARAVALEAAAALPEGLAGRPTAASRPSPAWRLMFARRRRSRPCAAGARPTPCRPTAARPRGSHALAGHRSLGVDDAGRARRRRSRRSRCARSRAASCSPSDNGAGLDRTRAASDPERPRRDAHLQRGTRPRRRAPARLVLEHHGREPLAQLHAPCFAASCRTPRRRWEVASHRHGPVGQHRCGMPPRGSLLAQTLVSAREPGEGAAVPLALSGDRRATTRRSATT